MRAATGQSPESELGALFERHFDHVFAYVAYRVAPDFESARDIAQDVFEAAWRDRGRLHQPSSATAWLMQIARNKVVDHFRSRRVARDRRMTMAAIDWTPLAGASVADDEARRERALRVAAAMQRLPDDQVELLEQKYIAGLSVRVIAEERRTSEKAVESALSRARAALRQSYEFVQANEERADEQVDTRR